MADSDYMPRKRSLFSFLTTILIIHFVFAFATYFIMYLFSLFLGQELAQTVGSLLSIVLFTGMLYTEAWRAGQHDQNLINFGHYDKDPYVGLKAALISQIPGVLLAVTAILRRLYEAFPSFFFALFRLFYLPFADILWLLGQVSLLFYLLAPLVTPLIVHIGYTMGLKGFNLSERILYQKKMSPEKRERKFR